MRFLLKICELMYVWNKKFFFPTFVRRHEITNFEWKPPDYYRIFLSALQATTNLNHLNARVQTPHRCRKMFAVVIRTFPCSLNLNSLIIFFWGGGYYVLYGRPGLHLVSNLFTSSFLIGSSTPAPMRTPGKPDLCSDLRL